VRLTIEVDLPDAFLVDVLTTAVEGGINYWVEECGEIIHTNDLGVLVVKKVLAEGESRVFDIDLTTVMKGIDRILSGSVQVRADLLGQVTRAVIALAQGGIDARFAAGEIDADGADVIVQAGAFAEIVYG
jgi:hypothetical protein